jgi:hypothetical protein
MITALGIYTNYSCTIWVVEQKNCYDYTVIQMVISPDENKQLEITKLT